MSGAIGLVRTIFGALLGRLLPGRGGHRATCSIGALAATARPPTVPRRRRLVYALRVPPDLLPPGDEGNRLVRPYVLAAQERQSLAKQRARRRELEEAVRALNAWSSGGGGRG
ncbi:hypothetical protein [Streptomyces sp. NPDC059080]|uniref:hypothetical protein n=1 Tax=Streptomyces sp. NPDC059080 TaxID=3346718 RepID=UPI0036CF2F71